MKVVLLTPWDHRCGNAEYAKKLVNAFPDEVTIIPVNLPNLTGIGQGFKDGRYLEQHFKNVLSRIEEIKPDVVHIQHEFVFFAHGVSRSSFVFNWVLRRLKFPIVITLHTIPQAFLSPGKRKLLRRFDPRRAIAAKRFLDALSLAKCIIVHNDDARSILAGVRKALENKIVVLQIPISKRPLSVAGEYLKSEGDKWLVMVGFVSEYKGHLSAIDVLRHLPDRYKLIVAGGRHPKDMGFTRYWSKILSNIDNFNLQNRVKFTGFLQSENEQAYYFERADAFLLPYREVGQSGSAVLADVMPYDAPVLTSNAISMQAYRQNIDTVHSALTLFEANVVGSGKVDELVGIEIANKIILNVETQDDRTLVMREHKANAQRNFSSEFIGYEHMRIYQQVMTETPVLVNPTNKKEI